MDNIEAEKGAIETYRELEEMTRNVDVVSNDKIKQILADEIEHLQELEDFITDQDIIVYNNEEDSNENFELEY